MDKNKQKRSRDLPVLEKAKNITSSTRQLPVGGIYRLEGSFSDKILQILNLTSQHLGFHNINE